MRPGITFVLALLSAAAGAQSADLADGMTACRAIENDADRLACYDGLAGTEAPPDPQEAPTPPPVPEAAAVPAPPAADAPPPAPENLGAEMLPAKSNEKEKISFSATLTRCGKAANGRYLFYFDNGQVWRQSNDGRLNLGDCKFDVTITKDFFGYKMQQVGEKKRIRIKRIR